MNLKTQGLNCEDESEKKLQRRKAHKLIYSNLKSAKVKSRLNSKKLDLVICTVIENRTKREKASYFGRDALGDVGQV